MMDRDQRIEAIGGHGGPFRPRAAVEATHQDGDSRQRRLECCQFTAYTLHDMN